MSGTKDTTRIEAFSDGVFAIAITLLILEIKVPHHTTSSTELWNELGKLWPSYFSFLFGFGTILIQWVNHHMLFTYMTRKSNAFIYANGFLLLTVSITPFPIAVLGEYLTGGSYQAAITLYCGYNLLSNLSWIILFRSLIKPVALYNEEGKKVMEKKFGQSKYLGATIYCATFILSFWFPYTALILNVSLWILWTVTSLASKE